MADIGAAMRARLIANSTVAGLVGARVYPSRIKQSSALPAVVYHLVSLREEVDLGGLTGVGHARLQVEAWAATKLQANTLAVAIRDALAAGGGRGTWGTVAVSGCVPTGSRDDTQDRGDGSDDPIYITSRDFLVSYNG